MFILLLSLPVLGNRDRWGRLLHCIRDWSSDDGRVGLPCWAALAGPRAAVLRRTAVPCCAACGCGCGCGKDGGCDGLLCCAAPPVAAGAAAARTVAATDCCAVLRRLWPRVQLRRGRWLRRTAVLCCAACDRGCSCGEDAGCDGLLCCAAPPVTTGAAAARSVTEMNCCAGLRL